MLKVLHSSRRDADAISAATVGQNKDQAELLHPKLVAVWAREDVGLTDKDYHSYVAIVKDFDKLWDHLVRPDSPRHARRKTTADFECPFPPD